MRSVVGVVLGAGLLVLTGCVQDAVIPTLPPTPTSPPIFASEEEALAAAEDAYAAYGEVSDLIAAEGGSDPERIAPFVTEDQLQNEMDAAAYYGDQQLHAEGRAATTKVELQQVSELNGFVEIAIYVCIDVSSVRILDASGNDVTPVDREPIAALEVVLVGDASDSLLIASSDVWPDSSFCSA